MDAEEKGLNTEDELKRILLASVSLKEWEMGAYVNRFVELIVELINERSEEKATEIMEYHKLDYCHEDI